MAHPPLRHLRSAVDNARPDGALMAEGQIAMNYAAATPAMFIKDSLGQAVKVGPTHVGAAAPNATPAGAVGNSLGESWLDTSGAEPVFKVWDGAQWVAAGGGGGGTATAIVAGEGLTGGTITETGAVALDTVYTDGRYVNVTGDTMTGALGMPLGSAAAPSVYFDSDTGLYSPGEDQLALATAGLQRVYVDALGNVGIGTPFTTSQRFAVRGPANAPILAVLEDTSGNGTRLLVSANDTTGVALNVRNTANTPKALILTNGADDEKARLAPDGYLRLSATSPGIQFKGDTAASNALDDYEEGTFVPTIVGLTTAGAGTYVTQSGRYTKIGNRVMIQITVTWSAHTGTGNMRVAGLPFAVTNIAEVQAPLALTASGVTFNGIMCAFTVNNSSQVYLRNYANGGPEGDIAMDTAGSLRLGGVYEAV